MSQPKLLLLWHMHQPPYWIPERSNVLLLPWVRLHAQRGYYDMATKLVQRGNVPVVFNITPTLLEQLLAYRDSGVLDIAQELCIKGADNLSLVDREHVIRNFFSAHREKLINPIPRYKELLQKAGNQVPGGIDSALRIYNVHDYTDLMVLFNLSWCGPTLRQENGFIRDLLEKGRNYTQEELVLLLAEHRRTISKVLDLIKKLAHHQITELSITPFHHPILPLVCNTDAAREQLPNNPLPKPPLLDSKSAFWHVREAINLTEKSLEYRPTGMWPAEGSVSPEACRIFSANGVKWVMTDRQVLNASRADSPHPSPFAPYAFETPSGPLAMFFRDTDIADRIGFKYMFMPVENAVNDFIGRVSELAYEANSVYPHNPVVVVSLDGENPWESYPDGGDFFLDRLYDRITGPNNFIASTPRAVLQESQGSNYYPKITSLASGSWIKGNFRIWIGGDEENSAWSMLRMTRLSLSQLETEIEHESDEAIKSLKMQKLNNAFKYYYRAQASDWFWWYGDIFTSNDDKYFDTLFRSNLISVYQALGKDVPPSLLVSLTGHTKSLWDRDIDGITEPRLDGKVSSYYEWANAGMVKAGQGAAMALGSHQPLAALYIGYCGRTVSFRVDCLDLAMIMLSDNRSINIKMTAFGQNDWTNPVNQQSLKLTRSAGKSQLTRELYLTSEQTDAHLPITDSIKTTIMQDCSMVDEIIEIRVPLDELELSPALEVSFVVELVEDSSVVQRIPMDGALSFTVPPRELKALMWDVLG